MDVNITNASELQRHQAMSVSLSALPISPLIHTPRILESEANMQTRDLCKAMSTKLSRKLRGQIYISRLSNLPTVLPLSHGPFFLERHSLDRTGRY